LLEDRFEKCSGTVCHWIHVVADVVKAFADDMVRRKPNHDEYVHNEFMEYRPFFDGCLEAIDGTHIPIKVDHCVKGNYMNRSGQATTNVCVIVRYEQACHLRCCWLYGLMA
jgi:hypothetical protein